MALLSKNPNHNEAERELYRLMAEPPARLEDVFDTPAIRRHIGELIVNSMRKSEWS